MDTAEQKLLALPTVRAAYSDRAAWLMANMSRLAYERFESDDTHLQALIDQLAESSDKDRIAQLVSSALASSRTPDADGRTRLESGLSRFGFELERVISVGATHAFVAKRESDRIAILAFRGTEMDFRDIKTDLYARFYKNADGSKTHTGFRKAYQLVREEVQAASRHLLESDYRLYVTGHSLGGALAIIATRDLNCDNLAACYTFGSPKVGNLEFGFSIKSPIYRVIHAADAVPRVPPTWLIEGLYRAARFTPLGWLARFLENMRGYAHWGDMRYVTAGTSPDYNDARIIPNLGLIRRSLRLMARVSMDWKSPLTDHGIAQYCKKLRICAERRLEVE